jgi:hypothetical protein
MVSRINQPFTHHGKVTKSSLEILSMVVYLLNLHNLAMIFPLFPPLMISFYSWKKNSQATQIMYVHIILKYFVQASSFYFITLTLILSLM